ncbi:MAG: YjbE family putative metal transport protein [Devosia nanyangense]|uniref:YjbE family putative metal transport protein n=1 Tax=Devosia nanyangense TaxID=1228055 RepID=A0A933KZ05_9HYPH|nr:YjbE family putative metal transport protein [Devosia nanyangense]
MPFDALVPAVTVFLQVVLIDLALAGDNAVVIGMAAAGLQGADRRRAIVAGIAGATVLRIVFATAATFLLQVVGLLLAGGILLLWVCWKMWRELRESAAVELAGEGADGQVGGAVAAPRKTLRQAIVQIILADVSMSLDNVLGVAGAAREHPVVLVFGLGLSVVLMGFAAALIANLLTRYRWIAYLGLLVILVVALEMVLHGTQETLPVVQRLL